MKPVFRLGVIGQNIAYSKSAEIFKAVFDSISAKGEFTIIDIGPDQLADTLKRLKDERFNGFSVTIPHKQTVMSHLREIDPSAAEIGAVNSVRVSDDKLTGYNTDVHGFALPLLTHKKLLSGRTAIILGNGGVARAAIYSLYHDFGVRSFLICGRDSDRLDLFHQTIAPMFEGSTISLMTQSDELAKSDYSLMVNCTPLGGFNHLDEIPFPAGNLEGRISIFYDLNYNMNNPLLDRARNSGMITIDGSVMLVGQALRSFEIWTGQVAEFHRVYPVVFSDQS
ncbi:MAG: shikimate dehydrogenase [candidate division Zixibacteria bacterium]